MKWLNDLIEPMLATLVDEIPKGDYVYEVKWDGIRALIFLRRRIRFKRATIMMLPGKFPELQEAVMAFKLTTEYPILK